MIKMWMDLFESQIKKPCSDEDVKESLKCSRTLLLMKSVAVFLP